MKTRKLLSLLMAVIMLFGCLTLSASAWSLPEELETGTVALYGTGKIASAQIPVAEKFTCLTADVEVTVYYTAEKAENLLDYLNFEEVAKLTADNIYIAESVIHLELAPYELTKEGYYYFSVNAGAAVTDDQTYSLAETTEGVQYQFESLDLFGKISAIFDYVMSIISNIFISGRNY